MNDKYKGLVVDGIYRPCEGSDPSFVFQVEWSHHRLGFGSVEFYWDGNRLCADTEHMDRAFLERLMKLVVEKVVIDG